MIKKTVINRIREDFAGKKLLIVGLGLQGGGVGLANFFSKIGAEVTVTDLKSETQLKPAVAKLTDQKIKLHLGGHQAVDFTGCDVIFIGPSVRWNLAHLHKASEKGITIETEAAFFASYFRKQIIGITGTRGKSTTSTMIYRTLKAAGKSVFLAGNVSGTSTISLLDKIEDDSLIVLELSSWQLAGFHRKKISPAMAVFNNFYPDHLNYYSSSSNYLYDKKAIYMYQKPSDYLIINKALRKILPEGGTAGNLVIFDRTDFKERLLFIKGGHNLENAAAAQATLKVLRIDQALIKDQLATFVGLSHRQEQVGKIGDLHIINDTTSTTPTATIQAINTFGNGKIFLILGGNSKNLPTDDLLKELKKVEKIVLLGGSFTQAFYPKLRKLYPNKISSVYNDLQAAIKQALKQANQSSGRRYLLFSPGATSFAMFNNEFHRGESFVAIIKSLINRNAQIEISKKT